MSKQDKPINGSKGRPHQVTWAQAFRDIIIAAMNRGQLLGLCVFLLLLLMVYKMEGQKVYELASSILESLKDGSTFGYGLAAVFATGWFFHARFMRRQFSSEYERIGNEKSGLQSALHGVKYLSSNRK